MEWNEKGAKIVETLKLRTPPVGVKFFEEKVDIEGAFKPSKHGLKFAVSQRPPLRDIVGEALFSKQMTLLARLRC